jgi:hypothetical protein
MSDFGVVEVVFGSVLARHGQGVCIRIAQVPRYVLCRYYVMGYKGGLSGHSSAQTRFSTEWRLAVKFNVRI